MNFVIFALVVVYLAGVWRFALGYRHTNFSRQLPTRIVLALGWPLFLAVNPSYRKNFQKAIKGR